MSHAIRRGWRARRASAAEPETFRRSRRQVLDEHVGAREQPLEDLRALGVLHVQRHRLLRAVQPHEIARRARRPSCRSARAKSPSPGRSILMTRAPRSASWRRGERRRTACSSATTKRPSRGRPERLSFTCSASSSPQAFRTPRTPKNPENPENPANPANPGTQYDRGMPSTCSPM